MEFREELYGNILTAYDNRINNDSPYYTVGEPKKNKIDFKVRVRPFEREGSNIRGIGSVIIGDSFAVNCISVLNGRNGLFAAMPSKRVAGRNGNEAPDYVDICFPVTKECREDMVGEILKAYDVALEKQQAGGREEQAKAPEGNVPSGQSDEDYIIVEGDDEMLPFR